ncbi:MAG: HAD family hydrolase [Candidatus Thermoplasmatota archaeon]
MSPSPAAPRAILFDLDGTLLDSKTSIRETMNTVLAERGQPTFTKAELDALIGHPLRDILAKKCSDPAVVEAMTQRYRVAYNESGWVTVRLFDGLETLLRTLRGQGMPLGVVTSKGQQETEILLVDLGIANLFDTVVGDDDRRPLKPDPAPILEACQSLGVAPAEVVMVGDTTFDIRAAKAAGATAVGVLWGNHDAATLKGAGADRLVATTPELARLLGAHKA